MYTIIEKVKGWARPGSYVTKQALGELVYDLEKEFLRRTAADFAEACERADLTGENKELKKQIKELQDRNAGLSLQKQILDNISHVGYHPDYVQELKEQIEELNVKLAKMHNTAVMYKDHYEFRLQKCQEIEALQQINAAILDVVAAQKDYTNKLEAVLGGVWSN